MERLLSQFPANKLCGRGQFEIHHIIPVHPSGAVYDIDNMRIMTPRLHIQTHSKKGDQ
ncbi:MULTISPECIES: HNH endonuclease signature motif containing protein [unclassified Pseudomonas]|uniref:HNH endonuclease signature motif containing protein n=1 Tax=unclassified Pseudomonas TaxID=196821 RepID=UPI003520D8A7